MLPIVENELVDRGEMLSMDEVLECYTLAQSLPGVIAANTASFIGYRLGKGAGAFFALIGVITPSIVIIGLIAAVFDEVKSIALVQSAFQGIRIVVLILLVDAIKKMYKKSIHKPFEFILMVVSFVCVLFDLLSPLTMLIISAVAMNLYKWRERVNHDDY